MNKEEFQKNEVGVEVEDRPEITSPEQNKSSKEWANEILNKIEQEFDSVPDNKEEIEKIESSVLLENQSTKNEIKNELNLENNLNSLNSEAENTKEEAKSKISEITGLGKEAQLELSEFSKRYSAFYRDQIAQKLVNLRSLYRTKLEEKPKEIESLDLSIKDDQLSIENINSEKTKDEDLQKSILEQKDKLNSEIEELKNSLDKRKNSFFYKIKEKFSSYKFDEESYELFRSEGMSKELIRKKMYREDFDIYQNIHAKKEDFENVNVSLQEKEKGIKDKETLLEKLKFSIEDKYKSINEAEEIIDSDYEIKELEKTIKGFYLEMAKQKIQIEAETKERSIGEISKEKGVLFCHSIPLQIITDNSFSQNNQVVGTNKFGPEEKIKMILGVEPTISVSTINESNQTLVGCFGVILKEGQVLSSYGGDAGTLLDKGIYNRKSKYDNELRTSIIQQEPEKSITKAIDHKDKNEDNPMNPGWNEVVVENPQVAGLFFQEDHSNRLYSSLGQAKEISKELNLPLYVLKENKIYSIDKDTNDLKEISKDNVLNSGKDFSAKEKKDLIGEMIDKEAFFKKEETIAEFNAYNIGKSYYELIKRIDSGEKIIVDRLQKDEVPKETDRIIQMVDRDWVIRVADLTEINESNLQKYYRKDSETGEIIFNPQIGPHHLQPSGKFEMSEDNISSYIDMANVELERMTKKIKEFENKDGNAGYFPIKKKSSIFILYGLGEECRKSGDIKNYDKVKSIIEKFGNLNECQAFVGKRVGADGKFQYLNEDVPIEIRKKIKELDNL